MIIESEAWRIVRENHIEVRWSSDVGWFLEFPSSVRVDRYLSAVERASLEGPAPDPVELVMIASSVFGWR